MPMRVPAATSCIRATRSCVATSMRSKSDFDSYLGTHVRRWAYSHLLAEKAMLRELWGRGAPGREAFFLPLIVPIARKLLPRAYKLTPDSIARSLNVVRDIVREVGERLKDGQHYLLAIGSPRRI